MPTTYVMEAKENYDPANVALINANTPHLYACTDQQNMGQSFDHIRKKLLYSCTIADADSTINGTGHTLWAGMFGGTASIAAPGSSVDTNDFWNLWIGEKDLTSGTVAFYQVYNGTATVPTGIGGYAHGWMYLTGIANGQTISLNGVTWTFVSGTAVGNQTQIQASDLLTVKQLSLDLNASLNGTIGSCTYAFEDIGILTLQYKTTGSVGNSFTISGGTPPVTQLSGAHLTGGSVGSDGTWRRMNYDFSTLGLNLPGMVNPRTNDLWMHGESCALYLLRKQDNFSQIISPLGPIQNLNSPMYPIGITSNWAYVMQSSSPSTTGQYFLHLIPGTLTATEVSADRLLSYAIFPYPTTGGQNQFFDMYFRQCFDHLGNFYVVSTQPPGVAKDIRFWKFTPPSSASFTGPVVGGGFTDITPWGPATGPNTFAGPYTVQDNVTTQARMDRNMLMFLPATQDMVAVNKFTQHETTSAVFTASGDGAGTLTVTALSSGTVTIGQYLYATSSTSLLGIVTGTITGVGGTGTYSYATPGLNFSSRSISATNPSDTFYDCTYVNVSSGTLTFDYHHAFVTGYMDSNWNPTNRLGASYVVNACQEFNLYLGMSDYDYGVDYTKRWFLFSCQPVSGGVIDPFNTKCVLVEYQFTSGSPPTVLHVYDDSGWTAAYPTYQSNISSAFVLWGSTVNGESGNFWDYYDFYYGDPGVYNFDDGSWWMSGENTNLFQLDAAFLPRLAQCNGTTEGRFATSMPPFVKLSVSSAITIQASTSIQAKGRLSQPVPVPPPPNPPPPTPPNPFNCLVPVISQYANSPILLTILENFCEALDPWPLINEFFNFLWNINTAVGYGLDVWGRIVGVTRVLEIPQGRFMGFEEQLGSTDPFNVSPFFAGTLSGESFSLSDDAFRLLILVKALANITDGSTKSINTILRTLFAGAGNAYVTDNENMTMTYTFDFVLDPVQSAIINQSGVLPRSTGVAATVSVL